jgi:serine O-acetyltransferase
MIFGLIENKILGGFWKLRLKYNSGNVFLKWLFRLIHKGYQYENNCYLPFNTVYLGPPNFFHGTSGIFISGDAVIGKNCSIFHQVTIGSNRLIDSKGFGSPIVGDNCLLGAGSKIIGKIKIGNNCRIGANCVVTDDIPDNCTVVPIKPLVLVKDNPVNKVYSKSSIGWGYIENGGFVLEMNETVLASIRKDTEIGRKNHLEIDD